MESREILDVLAMAESYKCRPSQIMCMDDPYVAYCFDEACALMINYLKEKKTPHFPGDAKENITLKKLEAGLL
jgi:hypothetical protein